MILMAYNTVKIVLRKLTKYGTHCKPETNIAKFVSAVSQTRVWIMFTNSTDSSLSSVYQLPTMV